MNLFEVKAKYSSIDEKTGKEKKVNATYLVDAVSISDSEQRLYSELEKIVSDEFDIYASKRANYSDLLLGNIGDKYYKCKIEFYTIDEQAGNEKKVNNYILVNADSLEDARTFLGVELDKYTVNCEVKSITETNIQDVFLYQ